MSSLAIVYQVTAAAAAPHAHESQLLDIDGTVFVMVGLFLLALLMLWPLLWKPYLRVRDERVARVDGAREKAIQLEADAAARLARIENALADARRAGEAETARLRLEAQTREQKIVAEAQDAARKMMAEAKGKLDATVATEKAALQQQQATLAREIAEKALGRRLAS